MIQTRRNCFARLFGVFAAGLSPALHAQKDFNAYSDADKESFLRQAAIRSVEQIGHGVTKPIRAEMDLRGVRHSAQIQGVNKELSDYFGENRARVPMMDSWRFNVAAYKIDRLIGLNMSTVSVQRTYLNKPAAFSWWVDDVMFEEVDRIKKGLESPDKESFERQRAVSRVFDELIFNIDRNLSNLLITKSWNLALIDHTRSFTPYPGIRNKENLTRCSRRLLTGLKKLESASVAATVEKFLTPAEISAMLARRDKIIAFFEQTVKEKGEASVLFG